MAVMGWLIAISMLLGIITYMIIKDMVEDKKENGFLTGEEKEEFTIFLEQYNAVNFPEKLLLVIGVGGNTISGLVDKLINLPFKN
ncbi:hypothetical protein [Priestia aryabhattai]